MKDAISEVLSTLHLRSAVYFKQGFCGPWGMEMKQGRFAQFHIVSRGQCLLETEDLEEEMVLESGDMVLFPNGAPHRLRGQENAACRLGSDVVSEIWAGMEPFDEGRENTTLICGHYELDQELKHPFFKQLPEPYPPPIYPVKMWTGYRGKVVTSSW